VRELESLIHELLPEADVDRLLSRQAPKNIPSKLSSGSQSPVPGSPTRQSSDELYDEVDNGDYPEVPEDDVPDDAIYGFDWNEEDQDALNDGMAALSVNPSNKGYFGVASSAVILRALKKPSDRDDMEESLSPPDSRQNSKPLDLDTSISLTAKYLTNEFIESYFEKYHTSYPFIHKETFLAQYRDEIPTPNNETWQILLNTVLALGAWCLHGETSNFDLYYYQNAKSYLSSYVFESGSIPLLQALTLLSNYAQKRNKPNTGWNYLGLAVRMAMGLGLYKEFSNWTSSKQQLQLEMRRRLWWGLYIFDGGAAITFGRPVNLPDAKMMNINEVSNIDDDDYVSMLGGKKELKTVEYPTIYSGLIWQAKFTIISTEIYNRLISSPTPSAQECLEMNNRIVKFINSLPPFFSEDRLVAERASKIPGTTKIPEWLAFTRYRLIWRYKNLQLILLRAFVWQRVIGVKHPDVFELASSPEGKQCRRICLEAAHETILSVSNFINNHDVAVISSWYATFFLFHACLISVVCLCSEPTSKHANSWKNDIVLAKNVLASLTKGNSLANKFITVIDNLCGKYLGEDSLAHGIANQDIPSFSHPFTNDIKSKSDQEILPDFDFNDISNNGGMNELLNLLPSDMVNIDVAQSTWPNQIAGGLMNMSSLTTPVKIEDSFENISNVPPRPAPLFTHSSSDFSNAVKEKINARQLQDKKYNSSQNEQVEQDFYSFFMTDAENPSAPSKTESWLYKR
jgi:transcriptional regulatory protein GAL4